MQFTESRENLDLKDQLVLLARLVHRVLKGHPDHLARLVHLEMPTSSPSITVSLQVGV
jgi:hypothetical protein